MSDDCSCLSQKIRFYAYHQRPWKWYEKLDFFRSKWIADTVITIHGETMADIDTKIESFKKDYASTFDEKVKINTFVI